MATATTKLNSRETEFLRELGQQLRVDSIRSSTAAGSGHPTFSKFGSRLQGHPTPALLWVDVATGSLGQGLPIAVGVALAGKYLDKLPYHVWTLCGDSELAEGSIWEGLDKASHYGLSNFTAIFDINRLGQRGETEYGWDTDVYKGRVEAFGCRALVIDGHDIEEIYQAL